VLGKQPETAPSPVLNVFALAGQRQIAPSPASAATGVSATAVASVAGGASRTAAPPSLSQTLGSQVQVNWVPGHWLGDERQVPPLFCPEEHHPQPLIGVQSPQETNLRQGSPYGTRLPRRRPSQPATMNSAAQANSNLRMQQP
jgi:hypothetical protein